MTSLHVGVEERAKDTLVDTDGFRTQVALPIADLAPTALPDTDSSKRRLVSFRTLATIGDTDDSLWLVATFQDEDSGNEALVVGLTGPRGSGLQRAASVVLRVERAAIGKQHLVACATALNGSVIVSCSGGDDRDLFWSDARSFSRISTSMLTAGDTIAAVAAESPARVASAAFAFCLAATKLGNWLLVQLRHSTTTRDGDDGEHHRPVASIAASVAKLGSIGELNGVGTPVSVALRQLLSGANCQGFVGYALFTCGTLLRATFPVKFDAISGPSSVMRRDAALEDGSLILVRESSRDGSISVLVCGPNAMTRVDDVPTASVAGAGEGGASGANVVAAPVAKRAVSAATPPAVVAQSPAIRVGARPVLDSSRPNPAQRLLPQLPTSSLFRKYPAFLAASRAVESEDPPAEPAVAVPELNESSQSPPRARSGEEAPKPIAAAVHRRGRARSSSPVRRRHHRPLLDDPHDLPDRGTGEVADNTRLVYRHRTLKLPTTGGAAAGSRSVLTFGKRSVAAAAVVRGALWLVLRSVVTSSRAAETPVGGVVSTYLAVNVDTMSVVAATQLPIDVSGTSVASLATLTSHPRSILWSVCSRGGEVNVWLRPTAAVAAQQQQASSALSPRRGTLGDTAVSDSPRSLNATLGPRSPSSAAAQRRSSAFSDTVNSSSLNATARSVSASGAMQPARVEELARELADVVAQINTTPVPARDPVLVARAQRSEQLAGQVRRLQERAATALWSKATQKVALLARFVTWRDHTVSQQVTRRNAKNAASVLTISAAANRQLRAAAFGAWLTRTRIRHAQRTALAQCELLFSSTRSAYVRETLQGYFAKWHRHALERRQALVLDVLCSFTETGRRRRALAQWRQFLKLRAASRSRQHLATALARSIGKSASNVIRREAFHRWLLAVQRRRLVAQRLRLVSALASTSTHGARQLVLSRWRGFAHRRAAIRRLRGVAETFASRSLVFLRAAVFNAWRRRAVERLQRDVVLRRCRSVLRSTVATALRCHAFAAWSRFVAQRNAAREERRRTIEAGVHGFLGATTRGQRQLAFSRWHRYAVERRAQKLAAEQQPSTSAGAFVRGTSSAALVQVYWGKWQRLVAARRRVHRQRAMLDRFMRHSASGLLAIYGAKWRAYVARRRTVRQRAAMGALIGRTSVNLLQRFYWRKWLALLDRRRNRRAQVRTTNLLATRRWGAVAGRYFGAWLQRVFVVCKHRTQSQLEQVHAAETQRRTLAAANAEQRLLLASLTSKALQVENANAAIRHMIERTTAHHDALASDVDTAQRLIERINFVAARQKVEKKRLASATHLRKFFYGRSALHLQRWADVQRSLDEIETKLRALPRDPAAAPPRPLRGVSPAGGSRLTSVLEAAAEGIAVSNSGCSPQTRGSRLAALSSDCTVGSKSPLRVPDLSPRGERATSNTATAASVQLDRSSRRAWLLQALADIEGVAMAARSELKNDLLAQVTEDEKHMWNVEGLVLGPAPAPWPAHHRNHHHQ